MKKALSCLISISIIASFPIMTFAAQKTYTATESQSKISINGTSFSAKDAKGKALPIIEIDGVLYVPAEAYTEALGKSFIPSADKKTVNVGEKKSTATSGSSSSSKPSAPNTSGQTIGQKNALEKAKSYISHMAFSYEGLISQLEYNKFSHEDAKYAADNCGADWNEQAAKKAESYLSHMSFSRDGLIEQLEYNGFTHEQAVYGADAVGY